jgi:murein DD-endopeptidase MepM/ murein hydrolase activator NlpD
LIGALICARTAVERSSAWFLPVNVANRQSFAEVRLTPIGEFGRPRQARMAVPAHLHTAVDLMRPNKNYVDEPIFPAAEGVVISLRTDGPFAQVIIEHQEFSGEYVWTVYEHVAEVSAALGEIVNSRQTIGRFFNKSELDNFGWQFDHLHFEILRKPPRRLQTDPRLPMRLYGAYTLECFSEEGLRKYYHDPLGFLESRWQTKKR